MKGKIQVGNLILRCEDVPNVTPSRMQHDQWDSEDSSYQVDTIPNVKEVQFKTSVTENRENLLKEIDGKTIIASSDFFDTFECIVSTQKYGISAGSSRAIYDITLKGDNSNAPK